MADEKREIGTIIERGGVPSTDDNLLLCNGDSVYKADYPGLYEKLLKKGLTEQSDGEKFKLPNLKPKTTDYKWVYVQAR
jgi:hypothetical protein